MAITKYASFEVNSILDVKGSMDRQQAPSFSKVAAFEDFRTEDGYLYARIRAISSRVNKNHDGWPSVELAGSQDIFDHHTASSDSGFTVNASKDAEYGFSTFLGKPIFVDHHNSDPSRARGVIVDAKLHVEDHKTAAIKDSYYADAPSNHTPPTWVELLLEVDAKSFPKLAKAIIDGSRNAKRGIDGFSMGCDVERSVCNICKNSATTPEDFCNHVKMKGAFFDYYDDMGRKTSKKAYEDCYGIKFFEISAVFDPADETALIREVTASNKGNHDICNDCGHLLSDDVHANCNPHGEHPDSWQIESSMNKFAPISEYDKYFGGKPGSAKKAHDSMIEEYGEEKGKEVFYATMNKKKNNQEKNSSEGFTPPESVQNNARRGLEMVESGEAGDGLESATKGRAHDIASGKALSLDHVKRMHSFFERHDKTRPDDGGKGNSPWKTAWMLWGGDSGRSWAESVVGREEGHSKDEKLGSAHESGNPKPQSEKTRAPESIDTLRKEKICEVCGSDMEGPQCDVCGWESEPEGFDHPDLEKAKEEREKREEKREHGDKHDKDHDKHDDHDKDSISSLESTNTKKLPLVSHVTDTDENSFDPKVAQINKIERPVLANPRPATNEPKEIIVEDQDKPNTSSIRTASDFVAAANYDKRKNMETQHIADAMSTAPAVAKPDYSTEVTGVGGVADSSNEAASAADAQVSVTDIGGVSGVGTGDEKTVEVAQGDEHSKNIEAIHTDTFGPGEGDSLGQHEPVSNEPFPASAEGVRSSHWVVSDVRGAEPADSVGKPDYRTDVSHGDANSITTQDSGPTATFPDGNSAVTRQADPVTPSDNFYEHQNSTENHPAGVESNDYAFGKDSSAHIMSAFKLADMEIELGLLDPASKYERVAELENAAPSVVEASLAYADRVRTAGLKKAVKTAKRLPSMAKGAASEAPKSQPEEADDSALFM
jgi:hypothetical protein